MKCCAATAHSISAASICPSAADGGSVIRSALRFQPVMSLKCVPGFRESPSSGSMRRSCCERAPRYRCAPRVRRRRNQAGGHQLLQHVGAVHGEVAVLEVFHREHLLAVLSVGDVELDGLLAHEPRRVRGKGHHRAHQPLPQVRPGRVRLRLKHQHAPLGVEPVLGRQPGEELVETDPPLQGFTRGSQARVRSVYPGFGHGGIVPATGRGGDIAPLPPPLHAVQVPGDWGRHGRMPPFHG